MWYKCPTYVEMQSKLNKTIPKLKKVPYTCNILVRNVWSVLNFEKLSNSLLLLEDMSIHVACISKTLFDSTTGKFTALIKERGFDIMHSPRQEKRGGGTAIIFKKNLKGETRRGKQLKVPIIRI